MSIITNPETSQQQPSSVVTLYILDCPRCHTLSVGDDVYENWKPGEVVACKKCGEEGLPRTSRMEIGV